MPWAAPWPTHPPTPFTKNPNRLAASTTANGNVTGPGGQDLIIGPGGRTCLVCYSWVDNMN